jgi:hypothetical protein
MVMQPSHTLREPVVNRMYEVAADSLLSGIDWGLLWMAALARSLHCILQRVWTNIAPWVVADLRSGEATVNHGLSEIRNASSLWMDYPLFTGVWGNQREVPRDSCAGVTVVNIICMAIHGDFSVNAFGGCPPCEG